MFFGHLPEILLICLIGLIVLGPKRMIDMGSALGKVVRELKEATKDLNLSTLLESNEPSKTTTATLGALSQFTQSLSNGLKEMSDPTAASAHSALSSSPTIVESTPTDVSQQPAEPTAAETDVLPH